MRMKELFAPFAFVAILQGQPVQTTGIVRAAGGLGINVAKITANCTANVDRQ